MRIAIDTGGTFTDCVYLSDGAIAVLKLLSTPDDPARSVLDAIRQITARVGAALQARPTHPRDRLEVRHGTTIGTNALLERKGACVAFVTTAGFEDTIAIGRQARQDLYNWMATPKPCLVPTELRFGVNERVGAEGEILISPSEEELAALSEKIRSSGAESVAISLLFSFANPENERHLTTALEKADAYVGTGEVARPAEQSSATPSRASLDRTLRLRSGQAREGTRSRMTSADGNVGGAQHPSLPISVSHEILPEFREYERAATVVVNAYLAPKAGGYMQRLQTAIQQEHQGELYVMQSSGGIVSAEIAAREPVRTVLSGPAGGVIGAHRVAQLAGFENIIGFDMGGTSTDVALIDAAGPKTTSEARVSDIPISVPMLDIQTVGAGGGSLAWFDRGGILHVGPMSAGADPGPICYGRGEQPTVTDANLLLGRLDAELALAGTVSIDEMRARVYMEKARGLIQSVEEFAAGIVRLAEAEMEKAIRLISVERGHDPREFSLVAFGGAGPLHACSLAKSLGIPRVLVPSLPGALSALGILMSDVVRDYSRTVMVQVGDTTPHRSAKGGAASTLDTVSALSHNFAELEAKAAAEFRKEGLTGVAIRSADLRYAGQGYEINVPAGVKMLESFHAAHSKRYGHSDESRTVEVVNVRVRMIASAEKIELPRRAKAEAECSLAILKRKSVMFGAEWRGTAVLDRERLLPGNRFEGPAIVHEYSATTVVPPGCRAEVDEYSNILIDVRMEIKGLN
jgi:N-methylhydantoinase A